MKLKSFLKNFDSKKLRAAFKVTAALFALILIINIISVTYTKYESNVDLNATSNIAFFVLDSGTYEDSIALEEVTPRSEPYLYTVHVNNFKDGKRANVNLKYTLTLETTTNLPLSFEVYEGENTTNILTNINYRQDGDMYFKDFTNDLFYNMPYNIDKTDNYVISVSYPEIYKDNPDLYQGKIESIVIKLHAEQIV